MAKKGQEPTTKFKVDISELKANITEANRQIRLANSEFKAAASGMDDWSKSADGISAKLKQLDSVLESENKKLDLLKEQHRLVAAEQGENSKAAEELMIKIHNQEAAVNKANSEIRKYNSILDELVSTADGAESGMQQLSDAVDDSADSAKGAEGGFTILKGALADLVADGIRTAVSAFKDLLTASDQAMGSFQAQTGASAQEMEQFNTQINDLYKNNFGEDLRDVADSMALVAQNTKEVDPSKIRDLTENALTFRDTFGWEVNETMRAANMLMDQFGLTGDEAFSLIAQGAQNGLDKNGDLLDSINEYSVHYEQLGLDAEQFFNSLQNGTAAGTFSVDKLGDAVKEFGIRVKDGSEGSAEAFETLGYDADEMFQIFNEGGDGAAEMMQNIIRELDEMPEGVEKTTAGVALFGTMWEDLGAEGIKALGNINGEADKTKATMDEIKNAKYSDIGHQFSEIGRIITTDFIQPVANEALPILKDGLTWVKDNIPLVTSSVVGLTAAFVTFKAAAAITGIIDSFTKFKAAQEGATAAQWLLNAAMSANPIGLVVAAIVGLVAAFVVLWNKSDAFREFWINLWEGIKDACSAAKDWISEKVKEIGEFFTETLPEYFDEAIKWVENNWQSLLLILINPFAGLFKYFYDNNHKFKEFVDTAIEYIKQLPGNVWTWLVNTMNKVTTWATNMKNAAKDTAMRFVNSIIEYVKQLPGKIWTWLSNALTKIILWGSDMIQKGKEAASDTVSEILDAFVSLPTDLYNAGWDALTGFWNGLKDVGKSIKKWATDFFNSILKKAEEVLEIGSPSKAMKRIAAWTMEGFDNEAVAKGKKVVQNVRSTFENVKAAASDALSGMNNGSNSIGKTIGTSQKTIQNVTNFYQTNNSPKALSRYEIYRQSKNLLNRGRVHV